MDRLQRVRCLLFAAEMHVVHCREDIQKFYKKHGYVPTVSFVGIAVSWDTQAHLLRFAALQGQTAPFPQENAGNGRPRETVKVPLHFICMEKKLV